jgi:hypothetical protein
MPFDIALESLVFARLNRLTDYVTRRDSLGLLELHKAWEGPRISSVDIVW